MANLKDIKITEVKVGEAICQKYTIHNSFLNMEWGVIAVPPHEVKKLPSEYTVTYSSGNTFIESGMEVSNHVLKYAYNDEPKKEAKRMQNLIRLNNLIENGTTKKALQKEYHNFTGVRKISVDDSLDEFVFVKLPRAVRQKWVEKEMEGEQEPFYLVYNDKPVTFWTSPKNIKGGHLLIEDGIPSIFIPENYSVGEYRVLLNNTGRGALTEYWVDERF